MGLLASFFYKYRRVSKAIRLFLMIAGPGIIVMMADNDAGGITTYIVTGSKFGYGLIWFVVLLGPVAYVVQEMTVRLGAVTKRGHAEAIFDSFGPFWWWFSLIDLGLVDWLTLITEFIGMTAAMSIFHVPAIVTVICVSVLMGVDEFETLLSGVASILFLISTRKLVSSQKVCLASYSLMDGRRSVIPTLII